jgi:hypothetical protein
MVTVQIVHNANPGDEHLFSIAMFALSVLLLNGENDF